MLKTESDPNSETKDGRTSSCLHEPGGVAIVLGQHVVPNREQQCGLRTHPRGRIDAKYARKYHLRKVLSSSSRDYGRL